MTAGQHPDNVPPSLIHRWREQVLTLAARMIFFLSLVAIGPGMVEAIADGDTWRPMLALMAMAVLAVVAFVRRLAYEIRAALLLGNVYVAACIWLIMSGPIGNGQTYFFLLVVLAGLLLQLRWALFVSTVAIVTMGLIYASFVVELLPLPVQSIDPDYAVLILFNRWLTQAIVSGVMIGVIALTSGRLRQSLRQADQAQTALLKLNAELEQRVAERTARLNELNETLQAEVQAHQQAELALRDSEEKFRSFVEQSWDGIVLVDPTGRVSEWNQAAEQMMGLRRTEVLGRPIWDVLFQISPADCHTPEVYEQLRSTTIEILRSGRTPWGHAGLVRDAILPGGERRTLRSLIFPIRTDRHTLAGSINHDVTEQTRIETDLRQRILQLEALRATMNQITSELDLDPLLQTIMERALALLGATSGQIALYDADRNDLLILACTNLEPDLVGTRQPLTERGTGYVVRTRQPLLIPDYTTWEGRLPQYTGLGGRALLLVPLLAGETVLGVIIVGHTDPQLSFGSADIELLTMFAQQATIVIQNAQLYGQIRHLATRDALTGLHNRRSFFDLAQRAYEHMVRYGTQLSIAMLDIDHFKQVNDQLGHMAGDEVLRAVARQCQESMRSVDIIARYGGEEIVVLLPETDNNQAQQVAERLRRTLADTAITTSWGSSSISVSIGIASIDRHTSLSLEQLVERADQALYVAKRDGRNRVICWKQHPG